MRKHRSISYSMIILSLCLSSCAPTAKLTYHSVKPNVAGYNFVIPRTVINVSVTSGTAPAAPATSAADKLPAPSKEPQKGGLQLSLITAPVAYGTDNKLLPVFSVTDDSAEWNFWTPTTLTSVSYADRYIVSAIGTQVTDNRSQVIDTAFSLAGLLGTLGGVGFAGAEAEKCDPKAPLSPPPPFAIDRFDQSTVAEFVPGTTKCWGYEVKVIHEEDGPDNYSILHRAGTPGIPEEPGLMLDQSVPWFPYPVCRSVKVSVYACDPNNSKKCVEKTGGPSLVGTANVSMGERYQRIILPVKGKIAFHPDFCVADVTNDSSGITSGWTLLQKAIADYQGLSQAGKATPKATTPAAAAPAASAQK